MYTYSYPQYSGDDLWWHWCPADTGVGQWVAVCRNRQLVHFTVARHCPYCGLRGTIVRSTQWDWPAFTDPELMRDIWIRIPPDLAS
jgi:hypothetical protein